MKLNKPEQTYTSLEIEKNKIDLNFYVSDTKAELAMLSYSVRRLSVMVGNLRNNLKIYTRTYHTPSFKQTSTVLGIETSCDDTGCAVVDGTGKILGESLYSQNDVHLKCGGVNPVMAHELHRDNIELACAEALKNAKLTIDEIDGIAVTTKPGLLISLQIGVKYARYLSRKHQKPLIPIHHMEAHALTARMYYDIPFPYLVLLLSGGDAILAVARDVDNFLLLGQSLDNAPGEVLDKVSRRMKLRNLAEYSKVSGGRAIELAAQKAADPKIFEFPLPLVRQRDCNFSFSGLKDSLVRKLVKKETEHNILGSDLIPEVYDLCAAFQLAVAEHISHRTERALLFCEKNHWIPSNKNVVISGGVACNDFIFKSIQLISNKMDYKVYRPPPKLCTDNGVMIAWNGIEKLKKGISTLENIDLKEIEPKTNFGISVIEEVKTANLQTKITRLNKLYAF